MLMLQDIIRTGGNSPNRRMQEKGEPIIKEDNNATKEKQKLCHRCNRYFAELEVYKVGRSEAFKCKGCNRLEGRLRTIKKQSGKEFCSAWDTLDPSTLQEFFNASSTLHGEALVEHMNATVTLFKKNQSKVYSGQQGQYWPLNYYREVLKFTEEQVRSIEANCPYQDDAKLGCKTYCYEIDGRGNQEEEIVGTKAAFRPVRTKRKRLASGDAEDEDPQESPEGDDQDKEDEDSPEAATSQSSSQSLPPKKDKKGQKGKKQGKKKKGGKGKKEKQKKGEEVDPKTKKEQEKEERDRHRKKEQESKEKKKCRSWPKSKASRSSASSRPSSPSWTPSRTPA